MPHVSDSNSEAQARENFSVWLQGVLAIERAKGKSKSAVAVAVGMNRNDIDRWLKKETFPRAQSVRKFCDALGLDYSEPARILGWDSASGHSASPEQLTAKIQRAKAIAQHKGTSPERRRVLEARIAAAEEARRSAANQRLSAQQQERAAEALLREALAEIEDAPER